MRMIKSNKNISVRCSSNDYWSCSVMGDSGNTYIVTFESYRHNTSTEYQAVKKDFRCTCPAFKFGKGAYCKHIKMVLSQRCGWDSRFDIEPEVSIGNDYFCPRCGADAHQYTWSLT